MLKINYENIKERLLPVVRNVEFADSIPSGAVTRQDGEFIYNYKILLEANRDGISSTNVLTGMLAEWRISEDKLHSDAMECLREHFPLHVDELGGMLSAMTGASFVYPEEKEQSLFVVTNNIMYCGSAYIFSESVREHLAKIVKGGYYILPSSIHEILILSDKAEVPNLTEMVIEINETQVARHERMANCVYHYNPETKLFEKTA